MFQARVGQIFCVELTKIAKIIISLRIFSTSHYSKIQNFSIFEIKQKKNHYLYFSPRHDSQPFLLSIFILQKWQRLTRDRVLITM